MKNNQTTLTDLLGIEHPIILAPMFLVSNLKMAVAAMEKNIGVCIPAMNYRSIDALEKAIAALQKAKTPKGAFGINLIVNKSNLKFKQQLAACCELGVDFIITSLGNPKPIIDRAKPRGIKVFCDVVNVEQAKKVEALGCDALIAVNSCAGGHRGAMPPEELIPELIRHCAIPVISAGGVGNRKELAAVLALGAMGASIGSPFIASEEADLSQEYKQACVDYGKDDVVVTRKISGTPCTVINTPYVQKVGTRETWMERLLNRNRNLKKWVKLLRYLKGSSEVIQAAKKVTYKTVWVAGPSIEHTHKIESVKEIIDRFIDADQKQL